MSWTPDICLYHANCNDGFAAAHVAHRKFPDTIFKAANYGQSWPELGDFEGKNVLLTDFSFDRNALLQIGQKARTVIVLDHHITAADNLREFMVPKPHAEDFSHLTADDWLMSTYEFAPRIAALFNGTECGATLTWKFFHPGHEIPLFLFYIRDHDLYLHDMTDSEAVSAAVSSFPRSFAAWDEMAESSGLKLLAEAGHHILRSNRQIISQLIDDAPVVSLAGFAVPVLNVIPPLASLAGHMLLQKFTALSFAATYYRNHNQYYWSLRSENRRQDVSLVAKTFGGGGHRNAAGFSTSADIIRAR